MNAWLASREPRERVALLIGTVAVVLALLYALAWHPLHKDLARNRLLIEQQRETLAWMQQAAAEVATLRAAGSSLEAPGSDGPRQSLVSFIEQSAGAADLGKHIVRMEPAGQDAVQLTLKDAPFDTLITWLAGLDGPGRPQPSALTAAHADDPGLVNATLTVERRPPQP